MSISRSEAPPPARLWATIRRRIRDGIPRRLRTRAMKRWLATHLLPEELLYPPAPPHGPDAALGASDSE